MGRGKFRGTLPEGDDATVAAHQVRNGMWLLDPETGEWANVKQAGRGNVCSWGSRTWRVSLRKYGEREFALDDSVTIRVPAPRPPGDDDADTTHMSEHTVEGNAPAWQHVSSCPRRSGADYCWCDPATPGNTHFTDLPRSSSLAPPVEGTP